MAATNGANATSPPRNVTVRRGVREISPVAAEAAAPVERGSTDHFVVSYDPALGQDGVTLADAILARCESDYSTLQGYFGGVTPPDLPFRVQVTTDDSGGRHVTRGLQSQQPITFAGSCPGANQTVRVTSVTDTAVAPVSAANPRSVSGPRELASEIVCPRELSVRASVLPISRRSRADSSTAL